MYVFPPAIGIMPTHTQNTDGLLSDLIGNQRFINDLDTQSQYDSVLVQCSQTYLTARFNPYLYFRTFAAVFSISAYFLHFLQIIENTIVELYETNCQYK